MPSLPISQSVTIIGAGIGGLTLGLAFKKNGIHPRFFELRDADYDFGGAIMLTPNALRVMDSIGVYSRIKSKGFEFEAMTFMTDPDHKITGKYYFGQKDMYGYDSLRIARKALIGELREMAKEAGIQIHYSQKFNKVVREDVDGVVFELADGRQEKTDILIGADGIHSKVRSYLFPDIQPQYSGFLGVTYCFPRANLPVPSADFPLPVSLHGKQGSFIMAAQGEGGKEIFVGRQYKYEATDRLGWNALLQQKEKLIDMHQRDQKEWSPLVQAAQAQLSTSDAHSLSIWPFHTVPRMQRWHSVAGRVIILGDAAHAIPPAVGQGANQAFEDGYSLALVLARSIGKESLVDALEAWEDYRLRRMDEVLKLTNQVLYVRMSQEDRVAVPEEMRWIVDESEAAMSQLSWLYVGDIERDVEGFLGDVSAL